MEDSYLGITVPEELLTFENSKISTDKNCKNTTWISQNNSIKDLKSDILIKKSKNGTVESVQYYDDWQELSKEIFYKGAAICKIDYYRHGSIYIEEEYDINNLLLSKKYFNKDGTKNCLVRYEYDKKNNIISILKTKDGKRILGKYEYDELDRVNDRRIYVDTELIIEQHYRYDILDRLSEYRDKTQIIKIKNISQSNKLLSYTITDSSGIEVHVKNNFDCDEYMNTELSTENNIIKVKNTNYVDNIMLKKPITSENDLDLILTSIIQKMAVPVTTGRTDYMDVLNRNLNNVIQLNLKSSAAIPISLRKRLLYEQAACPLL